MLGNRTKPGETLFAATLVVASTLLLWQAYRISGFEALSAPGSFPMAAASVMLATSIIVLFNAIRARPAESPGFFSEVLPPVIMVMIAMIGAYAILLRPAGFLPTSFLFLMVAAKFLYRKSWLRSAIISAVCLALIYVVFRLVFSVLMPEGIVAEREILAWLRQLLTTGDPP